MNTKIENGVLVYLVTDKERAFQDKARFTRHYYTVVPVIRCTDSSAFVEVDGISVRIRLSDFKVYGREWEAGLYETILLGDYRDFVISKSQYGASLEALKEIVSFQEWAAPKQIAHSGYFDRT